MYLDEHYYYSNEQEKEAEEEDGARGLSRPETVLDYTDAVLAVGEGRGGYKSRRPTADRSIQARARRVVSAVEQYGPEPCTSQPHARGAPVTPDRDVGEMIL